MNTTAATDHRRPFVSRSDVPFIAIAVTSGALLIYLGRSLTFWHDEWRSISFDGGVIDFLRPVNEHWSTFPLLLYRATFELVELRSYLPYLTQVIVLHLVAVSGAYVLMRRRVGRFAATLLSVPLLLLGAGAENLFWAFQTGFVASVMFGVWALFFIARTGGRSAVVASALLLASLMSSGIGLFFVVSAAGRTMFDRTYRPRLLAVVPPALAYLTWHFLIGRDAIGTTGELAGPSSVLRFALRGIGYSIEAMVGLVWLPSSAIIGLAVFTGLCAITVRDSVRGHARGLAAGALLGLASMYVGIGVARADLEFDYARSSRYVYVATFLLLLCVSDLMPDTTASRAIRGWMRLAILAAAGLLLGWTVSANAIELITTRDQFQARADLTRAFIDLANRHRGESWVDSRAHLLTLMPSVRELPALLEEYGSPVEDRLIPGVVSAPSRAAYQTALLYIVGNGFRVTPATAGGEYLPVRIVEQSSLERTRAGACVNVRPIGPEASLTLSVPGGTRVRATTDSSVNGRVGLGRDGPPWRFHSFGLTHESSKDIVIPDVGDGSRWSVRFEFPETGGRVQLCSIRSV